MRKLFANTERNLRYKYLLDVLDYIIRNTRQQQKWLLVQALEPFDREYILSDVKEFYPKDSWKEEFRKATSFYYRHDPADFDQWDKCNAEYNLVICTAKQFRDSLNVYVDEFQKDGTLDKIFGYKNPFLVLSLYSRAVLAYSQEPAVVILHSGLAVTNSEFLPEGDIDPLEEKSVSHFCSKLYPLKLWFRELEHRQYSFKEG